MNVQLSAPDLAIVGAYILAMTLFGVWFSRKQKDLRTYFVGDRNVGWFLVLMSIVATETSAVTFLSVPGLAYKVGGNLTYLQLAFGYILGRCLVAWLLLPMYMRGDMFSAYEVLRQRFNPAVQRVASGIFLLTRTLADGLRLFLTALLMQYVGISVEAAVVFVGVVTIIYTYLGGMKAVLWTDLIQFAIKIAGAALAGLFILRTLPGGWDALVSLAEPEGKFKLIDAAHVFEPGFPFNLMAGVVGGAVFSMASHGADQLMVQRYLCARSLGQARVALVLSGFTVTVQFLLFLLVGIGLWALVQSGAFVLPIRPDGREWKPDEIFGLFIVTKLPTGIVGVLIAAVLAAAMSTLSSSLNSSANALVTDFYRPLRPHHTEGWYVFVSRGLTAVWGVAQMAVAIGAYWFGGDKSVVEQVLKIAGLTTGLLLGLFILGTLRTRVSSSSALVGLLAGFAAVLAVWVPEVLKRPILAWPWFALVGTATTVAAALIAHALRRKPHGPVATPPDGSPQPGVRPAG